MPRTSVLQAASDALAAYLSTAMAASGGAVEVNSDWPEPDHQLRRGVTITSVGSRQVEYRDGQTANVINVAELVPPDPILKSYTFSVAVFRQDVQLDIWATSFVACDDILARLDDALSSGPGATLGIANADPFSDGCLVRLDPAGDYPFSFADFVFDGQDDDTTPAQVGRDEWRATMRGEFSVNYTLTRTLPRLTGITFKMKVIESTDPGETDVFTMNPDGTFSLIVTVP